MLLSDWARRLDINHSSLQERIDKWGIEKALTAPKDPRFNKGEIQWVS
jgi:hypothetical protein